MTAKRKSPPSPLRTGLVHVGFSVLTFATITGAFAAFVHFNGDASKASPTQIVGLFDEAPATHIPLKDRLNDDGHADPHAQSETHDDSPRLGVADLDDSHDEDDSGHDAEDDSGAPVRKVTAKTNSGLPIAPIPGVWERSPQGKLPRIADDGRTPLEVYRRPFSNPAGRPTISIVVGGLGLNRRVTQSAIDELPADVTLSFVPYSRGLQTWVDQARAAGHEVMIEFPMEPYDYPNNDTGPYTLLTTANASENRRRAEWLMAQATGYFGITNYQGAKYATDSRAISPVFEMLQERGLGFIHDGAAPRSVFETVAKNVQLPFTQAARVIDSDPSASAIDEHLLHLEAIALQTGHALGTGFAFPITIDQLRDWTSTLESKGYRLAPASSLLQSAPIFPMEDDHQAADSSSAHHDADHHGAR